MELLSIACEKLKSVLESVVCSSVYITKARYVTNQDDFYNMVVKGYVSDSMSPYDLLNIIHEVEAEGGRNREKEIRFGPRSLDIDIEEFGDIVVSDEILQIPHPRIQERAFVLIPALEILDESSDYLLRKRYESFLKDLPEQGVSKYSKLLDM
ncbi:MAG: 2-amino-4-hydroxy-6-hydroxymethyldihydropteridine diphosphokinase [Treponema sp.]|nr:2-amino-4-hydroxy-6-hydroxymethyldihydropteridine diphosphokinase [Treponema sp.]